MTQILSLVAEHNNSKKLKDGYFKSKEFLDYKETCDGYVALSGLKGMMGQSSSSVRRAKRTAGANIALFPSTSKRKSSKNPANHQDPKDSSEDDDNNYIDFNAVGS
jgi:hypothetical protein